MKNTLKIATLLILALVVTAPAFAQTATYSTTLAAAVNGTQTNVTVAATTSMLASTQTITQLLFCDGEEMKINTLNTTTKVAGVTRGYGPTRAGSPPLTGTHQSGAQCWYGAAGTVGPFVAQAPQPGTACVTANYAFLPLIVENTAAVFDCPTQTSRWQFWNPLTNAANGYTPVTSAYTAKLTDYIIGFTQVAAAATVTLPTPNLGMVGKVYIVRNQGTITTNTVWVGGGVTINGGTGSLAVNNGTTGLFVSVYTNGVAWFSF